ncbi:response regulator transcription factor [bacterium]|nr:response regulator transcription factor [bacterium]
MICSEVQELIKVFVADDHPLLRAGLRLSFTAEKGFDYVGEAADGFTAVDKVKAQCPDVCLIDIDMPGLSGIEVIRIIRKTSSEMIIFALSTFKDENYVRNAMKAGANGYLLKSIGLDALAEISRAFYRGEEIISPYLANLTIQCDGENESSKGPLDQLTRRENEVFNLVVKGKCNKDIARNLYISQDTVKTHVKNIYRKIHVRNRIEAMRVSHERKTRA